MADHVKRTDPIQGEILHEYDGIEEADNALPTWWLITFYGAIVFGIGYWFVYHEYEMLPGTPEAYASAMAERAGAGEADEATLVLLATNPDTVAQGQETFAGTCAACHGDQGQGQIGPNLTDSAWLHGGSAMDIYRSVKDGISADDARLTGSAGMPPWGPSLGERPVQAVVAYLLSIRDTNVAGREAEGEPYDPNAAPQEEAAVEEGEPSEAAAEPEAPEEAAADEAGADAAGGAADAPEEAEAAPEAPEAPVEETEAPTDT